MKSVFLLTLLLLFFFKVWLWFLYFSVPFFIIPPYPVSLCTGWVFCSLLLSLAGLLPGDPTDCSAAPQTEWVCVSHSYPALASHSWYFPSAWPVPPPAPYLLSRVTCRHVLNQHSLGSLLLINPSFDCMWIDFYLEPLGELSEVNFILMLFKPIASDPRPTDMHLPLMYFLFLWPWDIWITIFLSSYFKNVRTICSDMDRCILFEGAGLLDHCTFL